MIRNYGMRAHDLGKLTCEEINEALNQYQLTGIHFAPVKSLKDVHDDQAFLNRASEVYDFFETAQKTIFVLGYYVNHVHPDEKVRSLRMKTAKAYIESLSGRNGAALAMESFTLNSDNSPHFEDHTAIGYNAFLKRLVELVAYGETHNVDIVVEPAQHHILHDIHTTEKLIREIGSDRLKLIFDPVNMMTEELGMNQEAFFEQFIERFESRIHLIHLKDYAYVKGKKMFLSAGEGKLAYNVLHRLLSESNTPFDISLEGADITVLSKAVKFMKR